MFLLLVSLAVCAPPMLWAASAHGAQPTADHGDHFLGNGRFVTPEPQYPMLVYGDTREWTARVAFDAHGTATAAVIIRSSGSPQLDNMIVDWIVTHWKSLDGKPTTLVTSAN